MKGCLLRRVRRTMHVLPCLLAVLGPCGQALARPGTTCAEQAAIAERAAGIPTGLLLAIGKRESGRVDPESGQVLPWPWAVNREGDGRLFETSDAAIAYVAAARRAGVVSVDVGCFQINLKHHPDAFGTLQQAFDPAANAAYAARFLADLHAQTGSWQAAVARYHSATPERGLPYRDAVLATWRGLPDAGMALASGRMSAEPYREVMGIRVWTPHVGLSGPVIIPVSSGIARPLPEATRVADSRSLQTRP